MDQSVDQRFHKPECGYFFQEPLTLAPEIERRDKLDSDLWGTGHMLKRPGRRQPIFAAWKIAVPPNHVDNFSHGKIRQSVRLTSTQQTGEVGRALERLWPETKIIQKHPYTGLSLDGFKLPLAWGALLDACQCSRKVIPLDEDSHIWDFALQTRAKMLEIQ